MLAAPPAFAGLLALDLPRVRWLAAGHGLGAAWGLGRAWKGAGVSRVVLFPSSLSSRLAGLASGSRERIGFGGDAEADVGLTQRVARRPRGERHLEDEYLDLAQAAGGHLAPPRPLTPPEGAAGAADTLLADAGEPLVLAPGARYGPAKRWPVERFAAAARAWKRGRPVIVGGKEDMPEGAALATRLGSAAIDLSGRTDLPALAGVLARAAAVVSNDSGVAHLAAALGRLTVVVFGSTDPRWTAPRGPHVRVIWDRVSCSPCFRRTCPYVDSYACLRIIEPTRVVAELS